MVFDVILIYLNYLHMKKNWGFAGLFLLLTGCCNSNNINSVTVSELDLNRYIGQWYEIARFDHSFERGLVGCTANYSFKDDGTIRVINAGYKKTLDGTYKESEGKARRPNDAEPGKLEVAFFANFYSDYYVLELDSAYTYALVGSKCDRYLWILSRTPEMDSINLNFVLKRAEERGYDTKKLIWVEQIK